MIAEEESKRMLSADDLREVAAPEHGSDETSPALGSPPVEPANKNDDDGSKEESGLYRLYYGAQLLNILHYICVCAVLNFGTWIVAQGTTPKTGWIVLPWSAYSVGCATFHVILTYPFIFRACPRSATTASPPRLYLAAVAASVISLLVASLGGLVVLGLTHDYYNDRDMSRTVSCGRRHSCKCHPVTLEGDVYNISVVCFVFTTLVL
ncbi:hypothetical protein VTI28DRAFT_7313 [Corynascus sepedonium]